MSLPAKHSSWFIVNQVYFKDIQTLKVYFWDSKIFPLYKINYFFSLIFFDTNTNIHFLQTTDCNCRPKFVALFALIACLLPAIHWVDKSIIFPNKKLPTENKHIHTYVHFSLPFFRLVALLPWLHGWLKCYELPVICHKQNLLSYLLHFSFWNGFCNKEQEETIKIEE